MFGVATARTSDCLPAMCLCRIVQLGGCCSLFPLLQLTTELCCLVRRCQRSFVAKGSRERERTDSKCKRGEKTVNITGTSRISPTYFSLSNQWYQHCCHCCCWSRSPVVDWPERTAFVRHCFDFLPFHFHFRSRSFFGIDQK